MKKLILSLGLFAAISGTALAQEAKPAVTPTPAAQPASTADIKFDKMVHDYGTIQQGGNAECEFRFTNTGKEPLVITNCQGSCGCTVPQCPKDPILPGKTGVIKVKYDSNRVGPISKSVSVQSNAKSGTVVLQIKGTIEAKPVDEAFPANKPSQGAPLEKK